MRTERINALQVVEGDILHVQGYRVTASDVVNVEGVARYKLTSTPNASRPQTLPPGYEGMQSGGNKLAIVERELPAERQGMYRVLLIAGKECLVDEPFATRGAARRWAAYLVSDAYRKAHGLEHCPRLSSEVLNPEGRSIECHIV